MSYLYFDCLRYVLNYYLKREGPVCFVRFWEGTLLYRHDNIPGIHCHLCYHDVFFLKFYYSRLDTMKWKQHTITGPFILTWNANPYPRSLAQPLPKPQPLPLISDPGVHNPATELPIAIIAGSRGLYLEVLDSAIIILHVDIFCLRGLVVFHIYIWIFYIHI